MIISSDIRNIDFGKLRYMDIAVGSLYAHLGYLSSLDHELDAKNGRDHGTSVMLSKPFRMFLRQLLVYHIVLGLRKARLKQSDRAVANLLKRKDRVAEAKELSVEPYQIVDFGKRKLLIVTRKQSDLEFDSPCDPNRSLEKYGETSILSWNYYIYYLV
jgi:hypothetical protein|nr:MAG TPA: hypothetical protein [Caudoviricetes sp.]DAQ97857.1 MAG TPA: hypothetical protein [Caudoviricetes sp.]